MLSVLMAVYFRENPAFLESALSSVERQTRPPDEVVIVTDPVGDDLNAVLESFRTRLPLVVVSQPASVTLGEALRIGVERCSGELIARMDTDDICLPDRFQKQVEFMRDHPEIDLVGSSIAEFGEDPRQVTSIRIMPELHVNIVRTARSRCPVNHMTVMYRKRAVLMAGNYGDDRPMEDYKLWARMLMAGCRFHNLSEVLVLARTGNGMIRRRGGMTFMRAEVKLQRYFREIGFTSLPQHALNLCTRVPILIAPHGARRLMYKYVLRKPVPPSASYFQHAGQPDESKPEAGSALRL